MAVNQFAQPVVDPTHLAQRTTLRPLEPNALGVYKMSQQFTLAATLPNVSTVLSLRWGDATRVAVVWGIRLSMIQSAAFTATQAVTLAASVARSFTVSDSGGAAILSNISKRRTSMPSSLVTDLRIVNSATGLVAGTRTVDGGPMSQLAGLGFITTINQQLYGFQGDDYGGNPNSLYYPIVLAQNEGIIVTNGGGAIPAAGSMLVTVELAWSEVLAAVFT